MAAAKKRGKALGLSSIQQIRETHPKRSSEKEPFDLRKTLSQDNLSQNSNNNARWFRGKEERPAVVERPLTTSTPGPQQRTPGMNLADIMDGHKRTIHGPAKKGRRSYIPTMEEVRVAHEKRYGGKLANKERIRRNRERE